MFSEKPTLTIKEARRILGSKADEMSDKEVKKLLKTMANAARLIMKHSTVLKTINKPYNKI